MTRLLMEWLPLPDVGFDGMIFVFGVIFLMLFVSWLHEVGKKPIRPSREECERMARERIERAEREEKQRREEARRHTCEQNRKRQKEREDWKKRWEAYKQKVAEEAEAERRKEMVLR